MKIHISYSPGENTMKNHIITALAKLLPEVRVKRKAAASDDKHSHVYITTK